MPELGAVLDTFYEKMEGNPAVEEYSDRHGIQSAGILTVYDDERAGLIADYLRQRVAGKIVVEIGAGIGLLACHVAMDAKRVYAIEVEPSWASVFISFLYRRKPANLTFIFGKAEEARHLPQTLLTFARTRAANQCTAPLRASRQK